MSVATLSVCFTGRHRGPQCHSADRSLPDLMREEKTTFSEEMIIQGGRSAWCLC